MGKVGKERSSVNRRGEGGANEILVRLGVLGSRYSSGRRWEIFSPSQVSWIRYIRYTGYVRYMSGNW